MMNCPICNEGTRVTEVRSNDNDVRIRRRTCKNEDCGEVVHTYELSQMQLLEKLDGVLPIEMVDLISNALGLVFNAIETGEVRKTELDLFYNHFATGSHKEQSSLEFEFEGEPVDLEEFRVKKNNKSKNDDDVEQIKMEI